MNSDPNQTLFTKQHYSTLIFKGYLVLLEKILGKDQAKKSISSLPLGWDYLYTDSNWVSEEFSELFYNNLKLIPALPDDFHYQAGKIPMSKENLNSFQYLVIKSLNIETLFNKSIELSSHLNKVDKLTILYNSNGTCTLQIESNRDTEHLPSIAENWKGFFDAILQLQNAKVSRTSFRIDKKRIIISTNYLSHLNTIKKIFLATLIGTTYFSTYLIGKTYSFEVAFFFIFIFLIMIAIYYLKRQSDRANSELKLVQNIIRDQDEKYNLLYITNEKLHRRLSEANLLGGVISRITQKQSTQELINITLMEVKKTLGYDRVLYLNHDLKTDTLRVFDSIGFDLITSAYLKNYTVSISEQTNEGFHIGNIFKAKESILIEVNQDYLDSLSDFGKGMVISTGSTSFIASTVSTDRESFGVIFVDYKSEHKRLDQDDLKIVKNLSNQLAILMENTTSLEKEKSLRINFQKFVPQQVIQELSVPSQNGNTKTKKENIAVLISDIRGFTDLSTKVSPDTLVHALNFYLSEVSQIIYKNGGIVDKFLGDGILAVFNAFGDDPNPELNACKTAIEMQAHLPKINARIKSLYFKDGTNTPFKVGIGVNSGTAIIGRIGSEHKEEFTAIGNVVNIASRLQDLTKIYDDIVISEEVALKVSPFLHTEIVAKDIIIRGTSKPCNVYSVSNTQEQIEKIA